MTEDKIWCHSCNAFVSKGQIVTDAGGTWNHEGHPERLYHERIMYRVGKSPLEFHPMFTRAQTEPPK